MDASGLQIDYDTFRLIYERYWKKVYNYAKRILEDDLLAEDVVQQVFVSLWERRERLYIDNVEAYLIKSVKYVCLSEIKKKHRYALIENIVGETAASGIATDDGVRYKELETTINTILVPLTDTYQKMFRMRFEEGMDNRSLASHFQVSEKTIRNKLSMTLRVIREKLKIEGYK